MMLSNPQIALYSFDPIPGDIEKNAQRMAEIIKSYADSHIELLVFPEMSLPGYCLGDLHKAPTFVARQQKALKEIILPATKNIAVILGLTIEDNNKLFNGYAVLQNKTLVTQGKKTLLINDGVLEDSRFFKPGTPEEIEPVVLTIGEEKISLGILVCQDMWSDGEEINPSLILKQKGAEVLIVLNASPFYVEKTRDRYLVALKRVKETGLPLYYINSTGLQDIGKNLVIFDGEGFAILKDQSFFKERFKEASLVLPLEKSSFTPKQKDIYIYKPKELTTALIKTLQWFKQRTNVFSGAVIGLSGGIDSGVDAVLASIAFGSENLLCINMPSVYNSETTKDIAKKISEGLGCKYLVHPIQEIVNLRISLLERNLKKSIKSITKENIQARARGAILMEYSQEFNYMVIGNGNKTEFQRGYATLYGDIVGAIMPLGDVDKISVFEMGNYLASQGYPIPKELLTLLPSAELSENQDITQGKGDPFDYFIEAAVGIELIENGNTPQTLKKMFENRELDPQIWKNDWDNKSVYDKMSVNEFEKYAEQVARAIRQSYFKRVQAPPIPVVSRRAFGLDLRESLFPKVMF